MEIKNNKVNKQETHNFTAWVWTNQATAERRPTEPEDVFESIETFDIICTPDTVFTNAVLELLGEEAEELLDEPLTETSAKEYIENVDWSSGEAGIFAIYDNTAHKYLLGDGDEAYEWATLYQGEEDLEAYAKRIGKSFSDLIAMPESNARDTRKKSLYINERFNKEEFGKRFGVEDTELLDQFFASIDEMEANNEEDLDIDDNYNEQPADIMNEFDDNFDNEIEEPVNNEALILRTVRNKILSVDPNEQDSPELIRDIKEALSLENIEITEEEIQRYIDISLDAN